MSDGLYASAPTNRPRRCMRGAKGLRLRRIDDLLPAHGPRLGVESLPVCTFHAPRFNPGSGLTGCELPLFEPARVEASCARPTCAELDGVSHSAFHSDGEEGSLCLCWQHQPQPDDAGAASTEGPASFEAPLPGPSNSTLVPPSWHFTAVFNGTLCVMKTVCRS